MRRERDDVAVVSAGDAGGANAARTPSDDNPVGVLISRAPDDFVL
jgi:hypothetical protein